MDSYLSSSLWSLTAMGRSCTSARQPAFTLVSVRCWHNQCLPEQSIFENIFKIIVISITFKVELTGNSIYEYIHPLDHEEIGHLLTVQPLHYSQGIISFHYLKHWDGANPLISNWASWISCLHSPTNNLKENTLQILSWSVSSFSGWNVFSPKGTPVSQMEDTR